VLSDGERVLGRGSEPFAEVLRREGVLDDPTALPAALVAELFCRLVGPDPCSPITDAGHPSLRYVPPAIRATYAPPAITARGPDLNIAFWSVADRPWQVSRWTVTISPGGAVAAREVALGQAPAGRA
jgi:hypothetical protein